MSDTEIEDYENALRDAHLGPAPAVPVGVQPEAEWDGPTHAGDAQQHARYQDTDPEGDYYDGPGAGVQPAERAEDGRLRCRQCGTWNYPSEAMVKKAAAETAAVVAALREAVEQMPGEQWNTSMLRRTDVLAILAGRS